MANFGVNLEEVWQQASLIQPQAGPTKHSPYTVPVQPRAVVKEGFGNRPPQQYDVPISAPDYPTVTAPPVHYSEEYRPPPPSEIPRLKEQLTQQIDAVTDCQKEVLYLKNLVQTLKRELVDADQKWQHHQRAEKKRKMTNMIWMVVTILFLIAIVVLLVQMSQKINALASQPLMMV